MYLVFEGIDTAGKSTQVAKLKAVLKDAVTTKEPGGTLLGIKIRQLILHDEAKDPLTELFLFLADRREHFIEVIEPALKAGKDIISDRSFISGLAYAMINQNAELESLIRLNSMALNDTYPDAVVLFELTKAQLKARLSQKKSDGIEARGIAYLLEVQTMLISVTKKLNLPHIIIDADKPIAEIAEEILQFYTRIKEAQ